jgi:hypothetical protein
MLSVYICTFDARQRVVFINKLFEFEFYTTLVSETVLSVEKEESIQTTLYTKYKDKCRKYNKISPSMPG